MAIQVKKIQTENALELSIVQVRIEGKLSENDYSIFVSDIEGLVEKGKIRILLELVDFYGWTVGTLWHETKFASRHFHNIERVAVVGDKYWARGTFAFCKPFIAATVRYYDSKNIEDPKKWIWEGCEQNA